MTIATDKGFKIGELYKVARKKSGSPYYEVGMIVEFVEDDDSSCPWFKYVSGPTGIDTRHAHGIAIDLHNLKPLATTSNKPLLLLYINQQYPDDKVLKALVESL